jgi:hypothetical protein
MVNYIANSKNRKFKKQILAFFERLNFWAGKLPFSWRIILIMNMLLLLSLFFPWIHFEYRSAEPASFFAFSFYTGYIGYGILVSVIGIPFFLLSHTKKERIRASIPFRLSDTQAIVFIASLLITAMLHTIFMSQVFRQFADEVRLWDGFLIATSSTICTIIAVFFLSKNTKEQSRDIRYLDHSDIDTLSEYRSIIDGSSIKWEKKEDSNMSLPI